MLEGHDCRVDHAEPTTLSWEFHVSSSISSFSDDRLQESIA